MNPSAGRPLVLLCCDGNGAEGSQLPEPGRVKSGPGRANARTVPGDEHPERARPDGTPDGRRHQHRLTVNADRDLGLVSVNNDLITGESRQPVVVPTVDERHRLPGVVHLDGDNAEYSRVEPGPLAETGDSPVS